MIVNHNERNKCLKSERIWAIWHGFKKNCDKYVISIYTDMVFMYYAAPGLGRGILRCKVCKKTPHIFDKKVYTVNNNV